PFGWASALAPSVSRAASVLAQQGQTFRFETLHDWKGESFAAHTGDLARWHALAGNLLTNTEGLRKTDDKRLGFEAKTDYKNEFVSWLKAADESQSWVAALAEIRNAPVQGYRTDQLQTLESLIQVLWLASAQLSVRFAETAEVDFIEITQR